MTTPNKRHHVLVITGNPGDRRYTVECPGTTDACQMWRECEHPTCQPRTAENPDGYVDHEAWDDALFDDPDRHGVEHMPLLSTWCVPSAGQCFVRDNDNLSDAADDLARRLAPGRYPVTFQVEDEEYLILKLAEPVEATR